MPAISLTPYSPADNLLILNGYVAHGYADGTFIEVEANSETMKLEKGADNEAALVVLLDDSGMLTATFQQNSNTNSVLSALCQAKTIFSVMLKELNAPAGEEIRVQAERAFVQKMPKTSRGKELAPIEWKIVLIDMRQNNGGLDDGTV